MKTAPLRPWIATALIIELLLSNLACSLPRVERSPAGFGSATPECNEAFCVKPGATPAGEQTVFQSLDREPHPDDNMGEDTAEAPKAFQGDVFESKVPEELKKTFRGFGNSVLGFIDPKSGKVLGKGAIQLVGESFQEMEKESEIGGIKGWFQKRIKNNYDAAAIDPRMTLETPVIKRIYERSQELRKIAFEQVIDVMKDRDQRFGTLLMYLTHVALPMYDLITLLGGDTRLEKDPFSFYLFWLPNELIDGKEIVEASSGLTREELLKIRLAILGFTLTDIPDYAHYKRLDLSYQKRLANSIVALSNAVTLDNYVRGLKLTTLLTMLTQVEFLSQVLGDKRPLKTPDACRDPFNGGIPESITFRPLDTAERDSIFDNLISNNGLADYSPEFKEYLENYKTPDPTQSGFLGYSPFERVRAAQQALAQSSHSGNLEPVIPDDEGYDLYMNLKMERGIHEFQETLLSETFRKNLSSADQAMLKQIGDRAAKIFTLAEDDRVVGRTSQSFIDLMNEKKAVDWIDAVPESVKEELKKNVVVISMPPPESPDSWRRWGLSLLANFTAESVQKLESAEKKPANARTREEDHLLQRYTLACGGAGALTYNVGDYACPSFDSPKPRKVSLFAREVDAELTALKDPAHYIPPTEYMTPAFRKTYVSKLIPLWNALVKGQRESAIQPPVTPASLAAAQATSLLPKTVVSEWDYIQGQSETNPFASARLAYLIEMKRISEIPQPKSYSARYTRTKQELIQGGLKPAMESLGKTFRLNQTLQPFFAHQNLTEAERKTFWTKINDDSDAGNMRLLRGKFTSTQRSEKTFYDALDTVHSRTLLTRENALLTGREFTTDSAQYEKTVDKVFSSDAGRRGDLLYQLFLARGNESRQTELFANFVEEFEPDSGFAEEDARKSFLQLDTDLKTPIYKHLIRKAAVRRRAELTAELGELCALRPDSHDRFKQLVLSTVKSQERLNEAMGLKQTPESVKKKIDELGEMEWKEIKLAGVAMGLFIAGSVVAAFASGGALTPLVAYAATAVGGLGSLGAVTVGGPVIAKMWIDELPNVRERVAYVQTFKDLGFTDQESLDTAEGQIKTIQRWGIGLNIAFTLPMIKPTAEFLHTSMRTLGVAARSAKSVGYRAAAMQAQQEVALIKGEYNFGYRSIRLPTMSDIKKLSQINYRVEAIRIAGAAKNLVSHPSSAIEALGKPFQLAVREPTKILSDSAMLYAKQFGDDPEKLRSFLMAYGKKVKRVAGYNPEKGPGIWSRYVQKRVDIKTAIDEMLPELDRLGMKDFLIKYNQEFSDLVTKLPRRKRDILRMFTLEGIPGLDSRITILKEIALGRSAMLKQLGLNEAALRLVRESPIPLHLTFDLFHSFVNGVKSTADYSDSRIGRVTHEIMENVRANPKTEKLLGNFKTAELERYMFNPENESDEALGRLLWNSIPVEVLFNSGELRALASEVEKGSRRYKVIDEFDRWLSAKKVLYTAQRAQTAPH